MNINSLVKDTLKLSNPGIILKDSVRISNGHLYFKNNKLIEIRDNLYLVSLGKAACSMINPLTEILDKYLEDYIVITKKSYSRICKDKANVYESSHPYLSEISIESGNVLIEFLRKIRKNDTLVVLLSGGASSLVEKPVEHLDLNDILETYKVLVNFGLRIKEINIIRKALSDIKGGSILRYVKTKNIVVLVLSDVIGDDLGTIASGLFYPSKPNKKEVINIIKKYSLDKYLPESVLEYLKSKYRKSIFKFRPVHKIVYSNSMLIDDLTKRLKDKCNILKVRKNIDTGVEEVEKVIVSDINKSKDSGFIIYGGEWSVKVEGEGIGGPNQEIIARIILDILENKIDRDIEMLSIGTDGTDGPTDSAGGFVNAKVINKAINLGSNKIKKYIDNNDSYNLLSRLGNHIKTGPTYTNVNSVIIIEIK